MHTHNRGYYNYKPDLLIQGKNNMVTYRQTAGNYEQYIGSGFNVVYRPSGWSKRMQIKCEFGREKSDQNGNQYNGIQVSIQQLNDQHKVALSMPVYKGSFDVQPQSCPFCNKAIGFNETTDRWICGNTNCEFDYSRDSCKVMARIFDKARRGIYNPALLEQLSHFNSSIIRYDKIL